MTAARDDAGGGVMLRDRRGARSPGGEGAGGAGLYRSCPVVLPIAA